MVQVVACAKVPMWKKLALEGVIARITIEFDPHRV